MVKQLVENLSTRLLMPLAWRLSEERIGSTLSRFSETEADSAWQYLMAMQVTRDEALRRLLLKNFLEELEHSEKFGALASRFPGAMPKATLERQILARSEDEVPAFVAYAHLSELHVAGRFEAYATASLDPEVARVFRDIIEDETEHHSQTREELVHLAGSEQRAARLVRLAKLRKMKETATRFSQRIGDGMARVLLSAVYLVFAPVLVASCRRRMARRGGEVAIPARLADRPAQA